MSVEMALADASSSVKSVTVLSETPYEELPRAARARLGISPGQKNMLLRIVVRDLQRTLTDDEANLLRDRIYEVIHEGASGRGRAMSTLLDLGEPDRRPVPDDLDAHRGRVDLGAHLSTLA